ncbi:MAG TPA: glycosyl transferase [Cyclobacteriaceae bacterium]|nr:glycosyl transferase [Cyclobacteriaceae bacterium]
MGEKKVLIIAYYWPPSGGSGVQRWLKFVKYLPSFGWKPYVFTPENPAFELQDESLLKDIPAEAEIIRFPIWEPYAIFNSLSGKKEKSTGSFIQKEKQSFFQKISVWIRGNFIIPDPRRFWIRPSVRFLTEYLDKNQINTIITTGPPHSMHLIGLKLKKNKPSLKWIADFRDPWSEWGLLDSLRVGLIAKSLHRRLERKVLQQADEVITITPFYVKQFSRLGGRKVELVTNGFDEADFVNFKLKKSDRFLVRHVGIVNDKCDPRPFMNAVAELYNRNEEIRKVMTIEFVGTVHPAFKEFVNSNQTMAAFTVFTHPVPHKELMDIYASSAVTVLILTGYKDAEGYMPGKLFEYIATGLPVLGVGPVNGDAASILNQGQNGKMFDDKDQDGIQKFLETCFLNWKTSDAPSQGKASQFSRKELTGVLASLLSQK